MNPSTHPFSLARVLVPLAACFVAVGLARARGSAPPSQPAGLGADTSAITPAIIDAGRRIFHGKGTCFSCHGSSLEGGPVAPPLRKQKWKDAKGGELENILNVDMHGVAGTIMVAHPGGISDSEAVKVASYIWAVNHRNVKP